MYQIGSHYKENDVVCARRNVCVYKIFFIIFDHRVYIALTYLIVSPSLSFSFPHFVFYACVCHTVICGQFNGQQKNTHACSLDNKYTILTIRIYYADETKSKWTVVRYLLT